MYLIRKFLRLKVSEADLVRNFEISAHSILSMTERKIPFLTKLFPGEDLPAVALNSLKPAFEEVGKLESRKVQARKLLGKHLQSKQEEICLKYFGHDCPDILLPAYSIGLIENGDQFLNALALKMEQNEGGHEQFSKTAKAYFKKKYFFETYKNNVFLCLINELFGKIDNQDDVRRFEIIVTEHVKKLGVELLIKNSGKDEHIISSFADGYDFSETQKRIDLISRFIQGVELNSEKIIDQVCEEFPNLLLKNHEAFQSMMIDAGVK